MLVDNVGGILEENGFSYCGYSGCFDIAARRESLLLLKVLSNVDSFQEEQADNLKILSRDLDAQSMLVGMHTRRESLSDNIIYERFDIPTLTPRTLGRMLRGFLPVLYRSRGGLFVDVEPSQLRKARNDSGMSQAELAVKVGITKKSVYEHESRKMKIIYKNAVRMEKVLKTAIISPLEIKPNHAPDFSPRSRFESTISRKFNSIGFETDSVYKTPFNLIAKEKFLLISDVEEHTARAEKNAPYIAEFSRVAKTPAIIVTKEEINGDVPSIRPGELGELSANEIRKIINKW